MNILRDSVFACALFSSSESFSFPPSLSSRALTRVSKGSRIYPARNNAVAGDEQREESGGDKSGGGGGVEVQWNFWGKPRSGEEIVDFVSDVIFSSSSRGQHVDVISAEPPLIIVHGFLETEYCDEIVRAVLSPDEVGDVGEGKPRLRRSTMGAEQETSKHRTSSTAWLREEDCPVPLRTFAGRVSRLSGLPPSHMENLQVVRYGPGEEFQMHTDHLDSFNDFGCRGRLATCLVYLNDVASKSSPGELGSARQDEDSPVFTGGETYFHEFDAAVPPKKGSALFFWNTLERPGSPGYDANMFLNVDIKLRHAGLPVLSGEKWVANRWIHPVDFGAGVRGRDNT